MDPDRPAMESPSNDGENDGDEDLDEWREARHNVAFVRSKYPSIAARYYAQIVKSEFKLATTFKSERRVQTPIKPRFTPEEIEELQLRPNLSLPKVDEGLKNQVNDLVKAYRITKAIKKELQGRT